MAFLHARDARVPPLGLLLSGVTCGVAALVGRRTLSWYRHATAVARILSLFGAFLIPALLLYPSINFLAERATRRLITTQYASEAQNHVTRLQELTLEARSEIDRDPRLPGLVGEAATSGSLRELVRRLRDLAAHGVESRTFDFRDRAL